MLKITSDSYSGEVIIKPPELARDFLIASNDLGSQQNTKTSSNYGVKEGAVDGAKLGAELGAAIVGGLYTVEGFMGGAALGAPAGPLGSVTLGIVAATAYGTLGAGIGAVGGSVVGGILGSGYGWAVENLNNH